MEAFELQLENKIIKTIGSCLFALEQDNPTHGLSYVGMIAGLKWAQQLWEQSAERTLVLEDYRKQAAIDGDE